MYQDQENFNWFSQTLLTHKDKFYGTGGYLRVSIGTGTIDYKNFNSPTINLSITNQFQKNYGLNYSNVIDLVQTIKQIKKQENSNNSEIQRKYRDNLTLYIKIFIETNNNEPVVELQIIASQTDFTKIIIPIKVFLILEKCLNYFSESYFNICTSLLQTSINGEVVEIINRLPQLIKGISSQIVNTQNPNIQIYHEHNKVETNIDDFVVDDQDTIQYSWEQDKNQDKIQDSWEQDKNQDTIQYSCATETDELSSFLGDGMKNIYLPEIDEKEIEEKKEVLLEINSLFINKVLENDLMNLETLMHNITLEDNPVEAFGLELKRKLEINTADDFSVLPDISDGDFKTLSYLTKLLYKIIYQNYLDNNATISMTPPFKYKPKDITQDNREIAYDLLTIQLYIRLVKGRLQNKIVDETNNKSVFYLSLRSFTDIYTYSFLNGEDLTSIIKNRYKYYKQEGVFKSYEDLLKETGCSEIQDNELISSLEEFREKIIKKDIDIIKLFEALIPKNKLRLPTKNNFSIEQITKELVPLEVQEKLGKNVLDEVFLDNFTKTTPVSEEIINLFGQEVKVKKTPVIKSKFLNNLERIVDFYFDEVPDQYKDDFKEFVRNNDNTKIDLNNIEFPIDEFDENIVKALYLWDPELDEKITTSYQYFQKKINEEIMDKKLILASMQKFEDVTETEVKDEWDVF